MATGTGVQGLYARRVKRVVDLLLSAPVLLLLSPLLLLCALAVKLDSRGPILYMQERIGLDGRPFRLIKFRSMVVGAESKGAGVRVEAGDSRVTRVGRVLRRLSLDELPQLFNIIRGDMSFVGPRPTLRYQVELYDNRERRRLQVKPGVTGWAQVHGRNRIDWAERIRYDLEYVERVSMTLDLRILARTLPIVLAGGDIVSEVDYWKDRAAARSADASRTDPGSTGHQDTN
jgi:lipopolysaccharide/colanic/teichoic acid biosynthesis glycosyltransferase